MKSALANTRTRTLNERLRKSVEAAVNRLLISPTHSVRVSTKIARHILIQHETLLYNGTLYFTYVRNIGAGVKELYLREG